MKWQLRTKESFNSYNWKQRNVYFVPSSEKLNEFLKYFQLPQCFSETPVQAYLLNRSDHPVLRCKDHIKVIVCMISLSFQAAQRDEFHPVVSGNSTSWWFYFIPRWRIFLNGPGPPHRPLMNGLKKRFYSSRCGEKIGGL